MATARSGEGENTSNQEDFFGLNVSPIAQELFKLFDNFDTAVPSLVPGPRNYLNLPPLEKEALRLAAELNMTQLFANDLVELGPNELTGLRLETLNNVNEDENLTVPEQPSSRSPVSPQSQLVELQPCLQDLVIDCDQVPY